MFPIRERGEDNRDEAVQPDELFPIHEDCLLRARDLIGFQFQLEIRFWLSGAMENKVSNYQVIHLSFHKTAIRILGRTNDRFAPNIERSIHQNGATGDCCKCFDQRIKARIPIGIDRLDPGRVIDVRNRRRVPSGFVSNDRARWLFRTRLPSALGINWGNHKHVRRFAFELKIIAHVFPKHRGSKRTEASRNFTLRFITDCIFGERGSPNIERLPSALGPNSIRPCTQPMTFSFPQSTWRSG